MLEVNDVLVPSCFIITNQEINSPSLSSPEVAVNIATEHHSDLLVEKKIEHASKWLDRLSSLGTAIVEAVKDPVSHAIKTATEQLLDEDTLYLYLIDELTMLPLVIPNDPVYPIIIKKSNDGGLLPKILPLLKVSLILRKVLTGV
jgi:hypothetical protein